LSCLSSRSAVHRSAVVGVSVSDVLMTARLDIAEAAMSACGVAPTTMHAASHVAMNVSPEPVGSIDYRGGRGGVKCPLSPASVRASASEPRLPCVISTV